MVNLIDVFGSNILTRNSIKLFFDVLKKSKNKNFEINFSDIEFISRSCADEYLKLKETSKKKLVESNMSDSVYNMFLNIKRQYESADINFDFVISHEKGILLQ